MFLLDELSQGFGRTLPVFLQTEATECGLACLAMIASFHHHHIDLMILRRHFPISLKGATLSDVIQIAQKLHMGTRPLKLDLEDLSQLKLPCVLHWNFNHFVVLKEVNAKSITIHDPAVGERKLSWAEASSSFTGVALEIWPSTDFKPAKQQKSIGLRQSMGRVGGLRRSLGQILLLALVLEILGLVSPFFLQWVIDNVLVAADRYLLTTLAIGFGLLMLMQQAVVAIRSWVILYMGTTLNLQWRANVFSHLTGLPVQYFEKRHLGDVVSRFGAIDIIQRTLTTSFMEAVLDGLMTVVTLCMMFLYSPALAAIAVGTILLYAMSRWAWYGPLRNATDEQIIHGAKQQTHFLETIRGIKTIKLFQRQDHRRNSWLSLLVEQINADLRAQKLQLVCKLLNGLLFGTETVLVIWLGARLVLDGNFSVGVFMAFTAYKNQFDTRASALIDKFYELKMLQLQGSRLADIVLSEPESISSHHIVDIGNITPNISVTNLSFRYADQESLILDDINFTIEAGESVAIVGPSGCGKTTLLNVLLGILPATGEKSPSAGSASPAAAVISSVRWWEPFCKTTCCLRVRLQTTFISSTRMLTKLGWSNALR
jgi:ATP-binding cassette subfamily B protein RaxB